MYRNTDTDTDTLATQFTLITLTLTISQHRPRDFYLNEITYRNNSN